MPLVKTTTSRKTYDPVDRCIYCFKAVPEVARLTVEHIVAYSLGGLWELPAASCDECAEVTGALESFLARDVARAFRARHKFPSRRKYPSEFPFQVMSEAGAKSVNVALSDHHGLLTLPAIEPPAILQGYDEVQGRGTFSIKLWHHPSIDGLGRFANRHGGKGLSTGPINTETMARIVAKIAHSYCVAEGKLSPSEGLLPPVILGTSSSALWLVGGSLDEQPVRDSLHEISCEARSTPYGEFLVCRIQLFACLGGPLYLAVVKGADGRPAPS